MSSIFKKTFCGNNSFNEARDFVVQQAADLLPIRKDGSIAAANNAIAKAKDDERVKQTGAAEWLVTVTPSTRVTFEDWWSRIWPANCSSSKLVRSNPVAGRFLSRLKNYAY